MNREQRIKTAEETLAVLANGSYQNTANQRIEVGSLVEKAKNATRTYVLGDMPAVDLQRFTQPVALAVAIETCGAALHRLSCLGQQRIGLLNFASAKNPGGGFLNGSQAQEEALARSSGLYPCLLTQMAAFYEPNRENRSLLYLDAAICSPDVPFFRSDTGEYLPSPNVATVVTAPAPNAGAIANNQPQDLPLVLPTLAKRAAMVLQLFALSGVETVILGAWGCGVFRNDPRQVAQIFAELLQQGGPYSFAFKSVTFAIAGLKDDTNVNAFREKFENGND
nr:TIGR02452 family protein [uncultured Rhodoferax sp.]